MLFPGLISIAYEENWLNRSIQIKLTSLSAPDTTDRISLENNWDVDLQKLLKDDVNSISILLGFLFI